MAGLETATDLQGFEVETNLRELAKKEHSAAVALCRYHEVWSGRSPK